MEITGFEIGNKSAIGKVIYIDRFGNIITNIDGSALKQVLNFDKKILLFLGKKKFEMPFVKSYNFVKPGKLLATIGSSNYLEIALNQGEAAKKFDLKPGDKIKISFS